VSLQARIDGYLSAVDSLLAELGGAPAAGVVAPAALLAPQEPLSPPASPWS
jgi:hypothetical protein